MEIRYIVNYSWYLILPFMGMACLTPPSRGNLHMIIGVVHTPHYPTCRAFFYMHRFFFQVTFHLHFRVQAQVTSQGCTFPCMGKLG